MQSKSDRESRKLLSNGHHPLHFLAEAIPGFIYIKFYDWVNIHRKYADGFHNSYIDEKDSHIPSPLMLFTFTALAHALLEWQKNKCVYPNASKSMLKEDRPDRSNYFNDRNFSLHTTSCCTAKSRKALTSPDVADMDSILMNTSYTLLESYQQWVYDNTLATVNCQIQQAENQIAALVISMQAAHVMNEMLFDYYTSEVESEQPGIESCDPDIPIDNNSTDDELHVGMPGCSWEYRTDGDTHDERNAIPTVSELQCTATEPERFHLWSRSVDRCKGVFGNTADADEVVEAS